MNVGAVNLGTHGKSVSEPSPGESGLEGARVFEGHLSFAQGGADLFGHENSQLKTSETYREKTEKRRSEEDAANDARLAAVADMQLFKNFENELKLGSKMMLSRINQDMLQKKMDSAGVQGKIAQENADQKKPALHAAYQSAEDKAAGRAEPTAEAVRTEASQQKGARIGFDATDLEGEAKETAQKSAARPTGFDAAARDALKGGAEQNRAFLNQATQQTAAPRAQQNRSAVPNRAVQSEGKMSIEGAAKTAKSESSGSQNTGGLATGGKKFDSVANADKSGQKPSASTHAEEVAGKIKMMMSANKKEMVMKLSPEHLGKVEIKLRQIGDTIRGRLTVDNAAAKEALESSLSQLRQTLSEQGIQVEELFVAMKNDGAETAAFSFNEGQSSKRDFAEKGAGNASKSVEREEKAGASTPQKAPPAPISKNGMSIYA